MYTLLHDTGHILDLYCIRLSKVAPFCENYTKLYFDVKYLEKGLNRGTGRNFWWPFFHKKLPFLANIERCHKFLEYALSYQKTLFHTINQSQSFKTIYF